MSGTLVDHDSDSDSPQAKPHGRVDMCMCGVKVLLVVTASLTRIGSLNHVALLVVVCVAAVVQLYAYYMFQPYFNEKCNLCVRPCCVCVFLCEAACPPPHHTPLPSLCTL